MAAQSLHTGWSTWGCRRGNCQGRGVEVGASRLVDRGWGGGVDTSIVEVGGHWHGVVRVGVSRWCVEVGLKLVNRGGTMWGLSMWGVLYTPLVFDGLWPDPAIRQTQPDSLLVVRWSVRIDQKSAACPAPVPVQSGEVILKQKKHRTDSLPDVRRTSTVLEAENSQNMLSVKSDGCPTDFKWTFNGPYQL